MSEKWLRCNECGWIDAHNTTCSKHKDSPKHVIDHTLNYRVNGFHIEIELQKKYQEKIESLSKWVIDTQDEAIRRALIALGWTPPKE